MALAALGPAAAGSRQWKAGSLGLNCTMPSASDVMNYSSSCRLFGKLPSTLSAKLACVCFSSETLEWHYGRWTPYDSLNPAMHGLISILTRLLPSVVTDWRRAADGS
jgi:hypothetical protein